MTTEYKRVLRLNNIGVQLLQQGIYREAYDTFNAAVYFMCVLSLGSRRCCNEQKVTRQRLVKRVALAERQVCKRSFTTNDSSQPNNILLEPVSIQDEYGILHVQACVRYGPVGNTHRGYPILLQDIEHIDAYLHTTIIQYNFALAHICLSQVMPAHRLFYNSAFDLLRLAKRVMLDSAGHGEKMIEVQRIFVSEMILYALVPVFLKCRMIYEAQTTLVELYDLVYEPSVAYTTWMRGVHALDFWSNAAAASA